MVRTRSSSLVFLTCVVLGAGCTSGPERGLPRATTQEIRAAKLLDEGRVDESQAMFLQAAQLNPRPFIASIGIARCGVARGDFNMVTMALQQAYASAPKSPEANDLLGRTHLEVAKASSASIRVQHASTAASLFAAASRGDPSLPGLAYHTGMAKLLSGRPREAVTFLTIALTDDPTEDATHALVLAYKRLKNKKAVISMLEPLEREGRLSPALAKELTWARTASVPPPKKGVAPRR